MVSPAQRPVVRASFALAGAGSLGTFVAGAVQQILLAIRRHNAAIAEPGCAEDDPRLMHPLWGRIIVDSIGGSSAGALTGGQLTKALFEPAYLGENDPVDKKGTITGDWIAGADIEELAPKGNQPLTSGPVEAPGWTLLSAAKLYDVAVDALKATKSDYSPRTDPASPLSPNGVVALGITLTDLLGYHEYADFAPDMVLGHPSFGAVKEGEAHFSGLADRGARDLGVRKHAEIRRIFVSCDDRANETIDQFLARSRRRGRAKGVLWRDAASRLASLAAASAALPLALGPMALTDQAVEDEAHIRRLYMDGGVLNNKPIAPALRLARWQDELRLTSMTPPDAKGYERETVERELNYQRVCFFIDAFPDRSRGEWRSPHPDEALRGDEVMQLTPEAIAARDARIEDALSMPTRGLGVFFESLLTSLRAQDIRGIAESNYRVEERRRWIRSLVGRLNAPESDFALDGFRAAHAWAAVREATEGMDADESALNALAELVRDADRFSGLSGRRSVKMIPVFAPENLIGVLAGEAVYAVGGLLKREARVHDAMVGQQVARHVVDALRNEGRVGPVRLPDAPKDVVPEDTKRLVERMKVAAEAAVQGDGTGSAFVRGLVAFPLHLNPLVRMVRTRLNRHIRGLPPELPEDASVAETGADGPEDAGTEDSEF